MNPALDQTLAAGYKSSSQKIRKMGEQWVIDNMYCVACGNALKKFADNHPVGDAFCPACQAEYELKCIKNKFAPKIVDGAYKTMIAKIIAGEMPNLLLLAYTYGKFLVNDALVIPKHFFTPDLIIKRPPLKSGARRQGWVGCFINTSPLPAACKLYIIHGGQITPRAEVMKQFKQLAFVNEENLKNRGWMLDVLKCIERIDREEFSINDIYAFVPHLQKLHPENHHVEAKTRQQLQKLRDAGYIVFIGRGRYKMAHAKAIKSSSIPTG